MNNVLLKLDGISTVGEVVSVRRLESGRSAIEIHSKRVLPPGRSCWLHDATGSMIECVIAGSTKAGEVSVIELRTVEDPSFLAQSTEPVQ